jgi:hypothetical protein
MAEQSTPAFLPAGGVPPPVAGQPGNPAEDDAEADESDDEPDAQDAANTPVQDAGQQQDLTPEQRMQQLREKMKPPPGVQLGLPPDAVRSTPPE